MTTLRGFLRLTWVEMLLFLREWQAVFFSFVFLPMLLFLFGAIFRTHPGVELGGFAQGDLLLPIPMAIGIASNAIYTVSGPLAVYRERGILKRFWATPLRPYAVLLAQGAVVYAMTMLAALLLIGIAKFSFGLSAAVNPWAMWGAFTLGSAALISLGFLLGSLFPTARSTYAINSTIFFGMIFLSGTAIPLELLPPAVKGVAQFIPLTYVLDLLKHAWLGQGSWPLSQDLAVLGGLAVGATALAAALFRWD